MWELPVNSLKQGPFLAELDVFVEGDPLPALKEPRNAGDRRPLVVALIDAPATAHLVRDGDRLRLEIPAASLPCRLKLALSREVKEPALQSFAGLTPSE